MSKSIFECVFAFMLSIIVIPRLLSKDKSNIWNPLVFWAIYLCYYVLVPVINQKIVLGRDWADAAPVLLLGAIVSLLSILIGYNKLPTLKNCFKHTNQILDSTNKFRVGIALCGIAFISYGAIKGFSLNLIVQEQIEAKFNPEASYNNPTAYIEYFVSVFCIGCPLILTAAKRKKRYYIIFVGSIIVALIIYAISGFRYRILILIATLITTYYLFPKPKKINYLIVGSIAIVFFVGMAVIERTRSYGRGLDFTKIENHDISEMDAAESDFVSSFSAEVLKQYELDDYIFLEPIYTALTMPIPRVIFPEKPNGYYMREANLKVYRTIEYGNAFLYFAEAYISFGWLGIILQGLFIGWVCKIFWTNYKSHTKSLGSIILLGLFNGFCFVWVSRGYFAQVFTTYMYFIIIPFWIVRLLGNIKYFQASSPKFQ